MKEYPSRKKFIMDVRREKMTKIGTFENKTQI
jgi:hypothetical protein